MYSWDENGKKYSSVNVSNVKSDAGKSLFSSFTPVKYLQEKIHHHKKQQMHVHYVISSTTPFET
jgi:hypothetical protein